MKIKVLSQAAMLLLLSATIAHAGGKKYTCDDCSDECLKNPYAKGCPDICKSPDCQMNCDDCTPECLRNPYTPGCPDVCKNVECQSCSDCSDECKKHPDAEGCPDICKDIKCYSCDDCSVECITHPDGPDCPPACGDLNCNICDKYPKDCPADCRDDAANPDKCPAECKDVPDQCLPEAPQKVVTCDDCPIECKDNPEGKNCPSECQELNCWPEEAKTEHKFRFIGDLGYYRQSDPADYIFGRFGVEYPLNEKFSVLGMLGVAGQVKGDDGDDALMVDLIAQYNWELGGIDGFTGLGVGGWITSGDVDDDSGDTDLDLIANIGARVYGDPDAFNTSVFLEMRSAVDEFDGIKEYARFGAGVRFKF
jgi:hypothetical protein